MQENARLEESQRNEVPCKTAVSTFVASCCWSNTSNIQTCKALFCKYLQAAEELRRQEVGSNFCVFQV